MDRRGFLSVSLTGFAALEAFSPLLAKTADPNGDQISGGLATPVISANSLRALVGTRFTIRRDGESRAVTLTEVHDGPPSSAVEQFVAVFDGTQRVEPGVYTMQHPQLGRLDLRLDVANGTRCAAVFNLLRTPSSEAQHV